MKRNRHVVVRSGAAIALAAAIALVSVAQESEPRDPVAETAVAFLAALADEQRAAATFEFNNGERKNWQPVPMGEAGVRFELLTPPQREKLRALLATLLSTDGLATVDGVRLLEGLLVEMERTAGRPSPFHGAERYFVTVFGDPSRAGTWSLRFEGHHLSLTFTCKRGAWTAHGPLFVGAQPARVDGADHGGEHDDFRLLGRRDDDVRALVASLDDEQRAAAVLADRVPGNVFLVPGEDEGFSDERGLPGARMTIEQRAALLEALTGWAQLLRPDLAEQELVRMRANLDTTRVVWFGAHDVDAPHYWRIVGEHFAIEYVAPEADPNHVHAVWRDPTRDFGGEWLREHLAGE